MIGRCVNIKKILTIKMEVYAENEGVSVALHSEKQKFHTKKEKMKELKVNLRQSANFLIQLFYKTGQKYTCTQTKLGKLLSILAFLYARKGKKIFSETIYKYNCCGTIINELKVMFPERDIYIRSSYYDGNFQIDEYLNDSLFDPLLDESLEKYAKTNDISENVKKDIEDIFKKFGAFSATTIGSLINSIVDCDGITGYDGSINLNIIENLNPDCFSQSNVLIDYIFSN